MNPLRIYPGFSRRTNFTQGFNVLLCAIMLGALFGGRSSPAHAQAICFTLRDRDSHTLAGVVNSYYPGTATASAGSTTISIGQGSGAPVSIAAGDLLLVMQMQDAQINSQNTSNYGSGSSGGGGSGYTNPNNVGRYEYVVAMSAVDFASGGSLTIRGDGVGGGLLYTYTNANATSSFGQRRFQVVRVPTYLNVVLDGTVSASPWDGRVGGLVALEVVNTLDFAGQTITVDGLGFRGGGGRQLTGASRLSNTDYRRLSTYNANGAKGEGIAGTPRYVYMDGAVIDTTPPSGTDGYPNGSNARGGPGTAGGGGTDGNPSANDENSGGGGGGNAGAGGQGGYSWRSALDSGGRGGAAFAERSVSRVVLGGGGGAGTTNNGTGSPPAGVASSGAAGGGIVLLRVGAVSGAGAVSANGASSLDVLNDSTGGGGAGGSVVVVAPPTVSLGGLTVTAQGGNGGLVWPLQPPGGYPGERHGPGGGGGGGAVYLSSTPASLSVAGGQNGTTTNVADPYGATPGADGSSVTNASIADIPGAPAGFECYTPTAISLVELSASSTDRQYLPALLVLPLLFLALSAWMVKNHPQAVDSNRR